MLGTRREMGFSVPLTETCSSFCQRNVALNSRCFKVCTPIPPEPQFKNLALLGQSAIHYFFSFCVYMCGGHTRGPKVDTGGIPWAHFTDWSKVFWTQNLPILAGPATQLSLGILSACLAFTWGWESELGLSGLHSKLSSLGHLCCAAQHCILGCLWGSGQTHGGGHNRGRCPFIDLTDSERKHQRYKLPVPSPRRQSRPQQVSAVL